MARCLHPRTIKSPSLEAGTRVGVLAASYRYARDNIRRYAFETVVVPCGKCLNCLKNKQSSMVVRCKREAEQKGSFAFMTLTYDDDHLPLARSIWRVSKDTGECEVYFKPELFSTGISPDPSYCDLFKSISAGDSPRYLQYTLFEDSEYEYVVRITPSVCRFDVREWLKMSRIQYERDNGVKLPDFSYVAISEYGPRTCRPHYHLAFFGLQRTHLNYLLERWSYGKVKQVRMVSQINKDGSNGFLRASKYIGKYMSKGKFECESVKECAAERPRVCMSKRLGSRELEPIRRHCLCFDMYGEYDPETLRRPDGSFLSRLQVDALVEEIPKRLVYRVDERTVVPLPRVIRDRIFKCVPNVEYYEWLRNPESHNRRPNPPSKTVSSALWCMVTASLRDKHVRDDQQKFEQFFADHSERSLSENCAEFAYWEDYGYSLEEASLQEDYQVFYSKSHF